MEEPHFYELPGGLRIVYNQVPGTKVVHSGFIIDIGSRDEMPGEEGLAHFWEHMVFKGTGKRKPFHIINRLEVAGGELNAYTTKEKICIYASVLEGHFEKAVELLTDITFNSVFPEKEIVKEKNVILEEMNMYLDSPEDSIQDDFENMVFPGHPLGHNILGLPETVSSFSRKDFLDFLSRNLDLQKTVFSIAGNLPWKKVKKVVDKYLSTISGGKKSTLRKAFSGYSPAGKEYEKSFSQVHCVMGGQAFSLQDEKRIPFSILINLLGGPGMNSRLNLALREKFGYVYSVDAQFTPFSDTGMFAIYFATEKRYFDKSFSLVLKELEKLREKPLGKMQLHACKEQIKGQIAMSEESNLVKMQRMGKSILDKGKVLSISEIFSKIDKVSSTILQEVAVEALNEKDLSILTYLPSNGNH